MYIFGHNTDTLEHKMRSTVTDLNMFQGMTTSTLICLMFV